MTEFGIQDCKPIDTPMDPNSELLSDKGDN